MGPCVKGITPMNVNTNLVQMERHRRRNSGVEDEAPCSSPGKWRTSDRYKDAMALPRSTETHRH